MGKTISKRRQEMGEEAWIEYQKNRKRIKVLRYQDTHKGQKQSLKVVISRRRKKQLLIEYKGGKCEKCGFNESIPDCYSFHHLNPTQKSFGISSGLSNHGKSKSLEECKKEVDKCALVCNNCHAKIHYEKYINDIRNRAIDTNYNVSDLL